VVCPDLKLIRGGLEIVSPRFQGMDYGQHLFIKDLVISFGRRHGVGVEGDRLPEVVIALHREDSSSSKTKLSVLIWEGEDGGSGEGNLQGIKSLLFLGTPSPELIFSCEVIEGMSDLCKILDEAAVKVC
ncbi:hypothetical protein M404DRAFT_157717, partial [Pisolithus tinctorius Marx 270]